MTATDYNDFVSKAYQEAKQHDHWRIHAERHTMFELLGSDDNTLRGKTILDLACGDGFYSRELVARGAQRVVGVDASSAMIELAKQQEDPLSSSIEYMVSKVEDLHLDEKFDVIVAGYLLNYANNRNAALAMCKSIERHLKPGGRFFTVNNDINDYHQAYTPNHFEQTKVVGFVRRAPNTTSNDNIYQFQEGDPIHFDFYKSDGTLSFSLENYYLKRSTLQSVLEDGGLKNVRFHQPRLSPEAFNVAPKEYWDALLNPSSIVFIEAAEA